MGIKGLNKIISLYAGDSISTQHISNFKGTKIAIDSEILIYQYRANGDKNSHIYGFINNVFWYLKHDIIPIYVFDGMPSVSKKKNILSKRLSIKEKLYQNYEETETEMFEQLSKIKEPFKILDKETNVVIDELQKIHKKIVSLSVNRAHRQECKYLLKLMGIPYIHAFEDAEALCVSLYYKSIVDYIYTEDTDAILYSVSYLPKTRGYPKILRKNFMPNMITVIDVQKILSQFELNRKEFIDFCILCGCDFSETVPKLGPVKSYFIIKKYGSIENIKSSGIIELPDNFEYVEAREIFNKNHDKEVTTISLSEPDIEGLKEYLINERGINPYQIIEKLNYLTNGSKLVDLELFDTESSDSDFLEFD